MSRFGLFTVGCLALAMLLAGCQAQRPRIQNENELPPPLAETVETSLLRPVPGYTGDALGAEVVGVSEDEDLQIIELSIPIDPEQVDRVTVTGTDGRPLEIRRPIEIMADPENNKVGITIPLSKKRNLGFRVQLIDLPEQQ